ncbi:MAG: polysaccharide deacetylase family protein [Clostridia bacterium]|nr:polysaccharide deacetylase family protein [Clostridia bacterium]
MRGMLYRLASAAVCMLLLTSLCTVRTFAQVEVYRSVKTDDMRIALTFDDGPHPRQTAEILALLEQYGVRATFFMVGENVSNYPDAARAVVRAGHEVGNHTYSHEHIKNLNAERMEEELERCEDVLEELLEYHPHLFRPPEGKITPFVEECAEDGDYDLILWSLDTRDWEGKSADAIVQAVLNRIQPGDIVLMHDYIGSNGNTVRALERLLPELLSRGYDLVTVSELLGD